MIKQLTKKETLKTVAGVVYYKLWFDNQWFVVNSWTYKPAKLMDVYTQLTNLTEGNSYDFKYRKATLSGRQVVLITSIKEAQEEEFVWNSEEISEEEVFVTPEPLKQSTTVKAPQPTQPYIINNTAPLESYTSCLNEWSCPSCGKTDCDCIPF